ncbi:D-arabinono-1,4-lactone oxidase [Nocardioides insulae]|uniref:D-arabinono-1,4-lactone oxidase n=1 Tax=Nocardioides insulae TaxID=394734 RepID=UPI000490A2F7|nr:D-arabinono-1,4-lactone oxidase [Nocardioides insulae]
MSRLVWENWAGNQQGLPRAVAEPSSAAEVLAVLARARRDGRTVKAVGSGHSFTAIAATSGVLLDLDRMRGITAVDLPARRVRVLAGTPLYELNPALEDLGLALPNLGDIDRQTIAGAVATGTHGTGARRHGVAAAVTGVRLATADGSLLWCSAEEEADFFWAAQVGLGALGVVTEVELQCVPAFLLHAREGSGRLEDLLEGEAHRAAAAHDHFEFYWFPHTSRVQTKRNDRTDLPVSPLPRWRGWLDDELLANGAFELLNRVGARAPRTIPSLARVSSRALSDREYVDRSWRVFCTPRRVRFVECEYAVPRAALADVVGALRDWVEDHDVAVPFPVEVRVLAGDDVWLSTAYQRDTAYVAVHQYHRRVQPAYFDAFERIARDHAGRPHWGKLHTLTADDLAPLYPRFDDFRAVRDLLDPERLFRNPHLDRILG